MKRWNAVAVAGAALALAAVAAAHGDDEDKMAMPAAPSTSDGPAMIADVPADEWIISYFRHPEHSSLILWHIGLMIVGWAFVLPVGEFHKSPSD